MDKWKFFNNKTQQRFKHLTEYYDFHGLNAENFYCSKYSICNASQKDNTIKQFSGGTAGLMPFYDVQYNGKDVRVLIIGKETGHISYYKCGTFPNLEIHFKTILNWINFKNKNPHIRGTLITLQRIFNVDTEYIYSSFALSNLLRCSFQDREKSNSVSKVKDTRVMRENCMNYLVDEIKILEPTLIIFQGAWAIEGRKPFINYLADSLGSKMTILKKNRNGKYGLYEFSSFMCITTHHPAIFGNWIANLAPDSLWPMIDYLRNIGYLPIIDKGASLAYEQHVKTSVDSLIKGMPSNDVLRQ